MPIEHPHAGKPRAADHGPRAADEEPRAADERPDGIPANVAPSDYQASLLRLIEAATNDPSQIRRMVYQLARMNLRRETMQRAARLTASDVKECMLALETAISRVEADCSRADLTEVRFPRLEAEPLRLENRSTSWSASAPPASPASPAPPSPAPLSPAPESDEPPPGTSVLVPIRPPERFAARTELVQGERIALRTEPIAPLSAEPALARADKPQVEIVYPERENPETERVRRRAWRWFIAWPLIQLVGSIVICLVLYLAFTGQLGRLPGGQKTQQASSGEEAPRLPTSGLPLPSAFGVYAISNGALVELEPLPIKAPDPRVALSAEINKPSRALLPDGRVVFVVFRRDLVNSAPQKVAVRVVARVSRAVTLSVGKAVSVDLDAIWRIRSNSYDFKVSPLPENREMIALRPEPEDFALPAGRYAVVLGGQAYDFTVDGPVTAAAQCLESFEALNGPVFSECPPK